MDMKEGEEKVWSDYDIVRERERWRNETLTEMRSDDDDEIDMNDWPYYYYWMTSMMILLLYVMSWSIM